MGMYTPALLANQGRAAPEENVWPVEPNSFQMQDWDLWASGLETVGALSWGTIWVSSLTLRCYPKQSKQNLLG